MKTSMYALGAALLALAAPAQASGGLKCKTAGPAPVVINLGFGHVPSAGLFLAKLKDAGREVPVEATQWWMQGPELRLALVSTEHFKTELTLRAQWNEKSFAYDGSIERGGKTRWVRCRED